MRQFNRSVLLGVAISVFLSACGIKGPLYIPEKKYPQKTSLRIIAPISNQLSEV